MSSTTIAATTDAHDDSFELYDLKVEVIISPGASGKIMCGAKEGDHFLLQGEMLHLPEGQGFSIYSLGGFSLFPSAGVSVVFADPSFDCCLHGVCMIAAVLPLLAAKQRVAHRNDWMTSDAEIACPDPNCPSRLRITREAIRTFRHSEVTLVPLNPAASHPSS